MKTDIYMLIDEIIKRSEILGYYQAKKYDIEIIVNDLYILKTQLIELIEQYDHRQD